MLTSVLLNLNFILISIYCFYKTKQIIRCIQLLKYVINVEIKKQKVENFYILLHKLDFSFLKSTVNNSQSLFHQSFNLVHIKLLPILLSFINFIFCKTISTCSISNIYLKTRDWQRERMIY